MENMNSGYNGYQMSNRAIIAYDSGEKPLSKFDKDDLKELNSKLEDLEIHIQLKSVWQLKKFLEEKGRSSWHHTSIMCNDTSFYSIAYTLDDQSTEIEDVEREYISNVTIELLERISISKKEKIKKEKSNDYYYATLTFGVWEGTRNHPTLNWKTSNFIVLGKWAYSINPSGSGIQKIKMNRNHLVVTKKYSNRKPKNFDTNRVNILKKKLNV